MSAWAKPGVKCVCVDAAGTWGPDAPIENAVYTVRRVWVDEDGDTVMDFVELQRRQEACEAWGRQLGYFVHRFRPLITRTQEQDLEHFLPLLKTKEMAE